MSHSPVDPEDVLRLTLYVAGRTPGTERAVEDLRATIEERRDVELEMRVVDVLERPDLAEGALILATPTLVRESPKPARRLIGDLADTEKVLRALEVIPPADPTDDDEP